MEMITVQYVWEPYGQHFNRLVRPGRWGAWGGAREHGQLFNFLHIDLEYRPERLRECIEVLEGCISGKYDPGVVDGGNDGYLFYGGGHVIVYSNYVDDDRVLMTAEHALVVFRNIMATMDHPDYSNPYAEPFEPSTIEISATGEGALDEYYQRGGVTPVMPEKYLK